MRRSWALSRVALVVILRWLIFFVAAYLAAAGKGITGRGFPLLLGLFAASNLALGFVSPAAFQRWRLHYAVVAFDVVFISIAIWLTGDLDLYIFYFFTILMSSYGRRVQGSIVTAVVVSALYGWTAYQQGQLGSLLSPDLLLRLPFFYLVALMSSFMAEESKEEEERRIWAHVLLGMTQELGLCRDRRQMGMVLERALLELPRVRAVRLFFRGPAGWRDADDGGRVFDGAALGIGAAPARWEPVLLTGLGSRREPGPHPPGMPAAILGPFDLRAGGGGALAVYGSDFEGIGERLRETVGVAALSVARSLDNLEAFEKVAERAREVSALMQVSAAINSALDLDQVLSRLMDESTKLLGAEASALLLLDEATGELVFQVATGTSRDRLHQVRLRPGQGVAGWVAEHNRSVIVNDPQTDARFAGAVDRRTGFTTRNLAAAPLRVQERVIGVLEVVNRVPPGPFDEPALRLLEALADQAGIAIERARLHRHMEEQVNETIQMCLALEKEKSTVEVILASMIEGVLVADETGKIVLVNRSARRALSPDGTAWVPEYGRVAELLARSVREKGDFAETLAPELPGHRIYRARVAPMVTGMGKLLGAVAVLEDVTELTHLSELKSEFISQVSHELRTPLTSIRAAVDLIARRRAGPLTEQQQELAGMVLTETGSMARLINDLLDLSKIEAGMMRLEREAVDVRALVARVAEGLRVLAAEREIAVEVEVADGIGPVSADPRRLERVFVNLVSNALKFSPPGGRVDVGAEPSGEGAEAMVRCWVRDRGPGIAPEDCARIFEKFERGRATAVGGVPGTGLGLAIARGIVEEHGGRIWVESRPGEGSTFHFTLPRQEAKRRADAVAAPGANQGGERP